MATVKHNIAALEKATGKTISRDGSKFEMRHNGEVVSFHANGGSTAEDIFTCTAVCINVRHEGDVSDPMSDYSAGVFTDNIKQAIQLARWAK